jgi:threonylcarbamoyladenosine tRNA methylthiotransferase MtaB
MPKVALGFAGCKVNNYEIQALSGSLESQGMDIVPFNQQADCYIINSCGVTSRAEVSSRNLVRRARRLSPRAKILVTGCYAELKPDELSEIGIDLAIPNSDKEKIPGKVLELLEENGWKGGIDEPAEFGSVIISSMRGLTRGYVKIQEGCDRKCTYCTIWMSRGPVRSRNPKYVIDEINRLYENGYLETVLTGVHIGQYSYENIDLTDLVKMILENTDIPRVRLSSMYPSEINDGFIPMFENKRICPHVHLSIQSGDDAILKKMGRLYKSIDLRSLIESLSRFVPGITIGADLIVGFPGESDRQFQNSVELVERFAIHHLHVFSFSARPGTKAAEMGDVIPPVVIKERADILRDLGDRKKKEHMARFINKYLQVLIEKRKSPDNGILTGLSENYLRVNVYGDKSLMGKIIKIKPDSIKDNILFGDTKPLNQPESY